MDHSNQEAIQMFMSITGASQSSALENLQVHGWDLNEAVNAYFNEGDHSRAPLENNNTSQPMEEDELDVIGNRNSLDPFAFERLPTGLGPRLPFIPNSNDLQRIPATTRNVPIESSERLPTGLGPRVPFIPNLNDLQRLPATIRNVPIESSDNSRQTVERSPSMTMNEDSVGAEVRAIPVDEDFHATTSSLRHPHVGRSYDAVPTAPLADGEEGSDIEEQMIKAAIEASKREADAAIANPQNDLQRIEDVSAINQRASGIEYDDIARAVSLSLKTAQQENAFRELQGVNGTTIDNFLSDNVTASGPSGGPPSHMAQDTGNLLNRNDLNLMEDTEEIEEQPLARRRGTRALTVSSAEISSRVIVDTDSLPSSSEPSGIASNSPANADALHEWGGISSQEHDEAVMLEAALFGGIQEPYRRQLARQPSPKLEAERLLREQQDDEYLASLQADMVKAELKHKEEEAAREAAAAEEKRLKEEAVRRKQEEEEAERLLELKKARLPLEPPSEDENSVALHVRMPDGSRQGRRFLKSDRLESLFDFIDVTGVVKPGSYRLVRAFPRRAFTVGENASTFLELGLTSKQEALYLELM